MRNSSRWTKNKLSSWKLDFLIQQSLQMLLSFIARRLDLSANNAVDPTFGDQKPTIEWTYVEIKHCSLLEDVTWSLKNVRFSKDSVRRISTNLTNLGTVLFDFKWFALHRCRKKSQPLDNKSRRRCGRHTPWSSAMIDNFCTHEATRKRQRNLQSGLNHFSTSPSTPPGHLYCLTRLKCDCH